jgi:hypothetical protein
MSDTMTVDLELLIFDVRDGDLVYQRVCSRTLDQLDPDVSASMLLSRFVFNPEANPPRFLLHSTSWRYSDGAIILTYFACGRHVELDPSQSVETVSTAQLVHGTVERPAPEDIPQSAVAAHALRHAKSLLSGPMGPEYRKALSAAQITALEHLNGPTQDEATVR